MATRRTGGRSSGMSRQEAGRRGAAARWGKISTRSRTTLKTPRGGSLTRTSSRQITGQRAGRAVARGRGPEFFEDIGRRGGRAVLQEYGPEHYRDIGRRGGQRVAATRGAGFYEDIGRRGGRAVLQEYGPEFFEEIGRKGGQARWAGSSGTRNVRSRSTSSRGGGRVQHIRAGQKGAAVRWGLSSHEDEFGGNLSNRSTSSRGRTSRSSVGRKGGLVTAARRSNTGYSTLARKGVSKRRISR